MKQEISPKETSRAQAFELALLVHRQGSQSDERILFAA